VHVTSLLLTFAAEGGRRCGWTCCSLVISAASILQEPATNWFRWDWLSALGVKTS